jgi:alcohol dehydrogenase
VTATSRGATLVAPGRLEIREYPLPDVGRDGALLAIELGGVCGTDVKYYRGRIELPLPVILGHEILGRVAALGPDAAALHGVREGDRVILKGSRGCGHCAACLRGAPRFCRTRTGYGGFTSCAEPPHLFGGFADHLYVAPDALLLPVSEALSAEAAVVVASVMANGFQWAVRQGGATIGSYVVIQGPGQQGLACTFAARHAGAARIVVTGLSRDEPRLALARRWGADRIVDVERESIVDVVREETAGELADVVVDVSGSPDAVRSSIECLRPQGTLVLAGLTGSATATPMLLDRLVWKELRVQGAFTADSDAIVATLRLVEASGFPVEEMVSHTFSLEETAACIEAIEGRRGPIPTKAVIRP